MAKRIGELLVEAGVLSQSQLEQALFAQRKDGRKLGQLLIELGFANEVQLTQTLSRQLSVPWVSLYHVDFSRQLLNLVSREVAEKYGLVPIFVRRIRKQGETLYVAMDDPTNEVALEDVARQAQLPVKPMIACPSDIRAAIRVYYLGETAPVAPAPPQVVPPVAPAPIGAQPPPRPLPPTPPELRSVAPLPPPASAVPVPPKPAAEAPKPEAPKPEAPKPAAEAPPPPSLRVAPPEPKTDPTMSRPPESAPEGDARPRRRPRMISLTLLDGTSVSIPAPGRRPSRPEIEPVPGGQPAGPAKVSDQLTARDLISALRAVANGVDASEVLGTEPKWEALFAVLLSVLLKKGIIADWEFIEEFRKV